MSRLSRLGDSIFLRESPVPQQELALLSINLGPQEFIIQQESNEDIWQVIRQLKDWKRGHELAEGDVLRLGRVKLKVKQLVTVLAEQENENRNVAIPNLEGEAVCRFCLHDMNSEADPLISPCKCTGTLKFVHVMCLQDWLRSKINTRHSSRVASYFWKDIRCELCKGSIPYSLNLGNRTVDLIGLKYPNKPYLVLEDVRPDREDSFGIHIITLDLKQSIVIGRSHGSDIKLSDISVSRDHAVIKNIGNRFFISDSNSKFGTLLLMKNQLVLGYKDEIIVQVSRSVFHFTVKRPWSCGCCPSEPIVPEYTIVNNGDGVDDPCARELNDE